MRITMKHDGVGIKIAKGKTLDKLGEYMGVPRGKRWKFFKESDKSYRKRLAESVRSVS